ncbi:AEC family transporter [Gracilibacillus sp. YIM 98692]|uniref:AEC family transporter n=1 Tax=Gracilibacillus sp. YIM 98692 TaxID=2663532 RepID=UPI0013D7E05B|nr:AEC family transporter [Gracilibacillus sp. YIM 98692]
MIKVVMSRVGGFCIYTDFLFTITLIIVGLALGKQLKALERKNIIVESVPLARILQWSAKLAIIIFSPVIVIGAVWLVDLNHIKLILLPLLGVLTLVLGGLFSFLASKVLKLTRPKIGSMFTSGAFSNWGSFGVFICFVFLGEESLAYVAMFMLFEQFLYYSTFFPIAKFLGESKDTVKKWSEIILRLITDPLIVASFSAIVIGIILNVFKLSRPEFYSTLNEVLVPLLTFILVVSTGYNMKFRAVKGYVKESFVISTIKFIVVPLIVVTIGFLFGLDDLNNGIVINVILIMAVMPPAFMSLIPPQLYKLDVDLANSSWLLNTVLWILLLPIMYGIVRYI